MPQETPQLLLMKMLRHLGKVVSPINNLNIVQILLAVPGTAAEITQSTKQDKRLVNRSLHSLRRGRYVTAEGETTPLTWKLTDKGAKVHRAFDLKPKTKEAA